MPAAPLGKALRSLGEIHAHARHLAATKKRLWPLLPEDLQPHCDLANYRDGVLILTAASPAWATRLRLSSAQIIHTLRLHGKIPVERIEVRIVVPEPPAAPPPPREISPTARRHLRRGAELLGRKDNG